MGIKVVAARRRNLPGRFAHSQRGQLEGAVIDAALCANLLHRLAVDAAFVQLGPSRANQRADWPADFELRIQQAGRGEVRAGDWPQIVQAHLACAQAKMEQGIAIEGWNGRNAMHNNGRGCNQSAAEVDFNASAAQQAVLNRNALGGVASSGLN